MRITIITHCIYPQQSPRSFRSFELAKQLAKVHEVTLYAVLGDYDYTKIAKETGIIIKSLGKSRFGNIDSCDHRNLNIVYRIITRFFGRFLEFPEIELCPKAKKATLQVKDSSDMIISIGKPYAIHWGVALAKKKCKKFPMWISDCGDPYMGNPSNTPPPYFEKVERFWCNQTDYITVPIENAKDAYYKEFRDKIRVIPQGFDFESVQLKAYKANKIPTFVFAGNVVTQVREPHHFLIYLSSLTIDFRFIVYTKSVAYFEKYKKVLGEKLVINGFIKREDLLKELSGADFLINLANKSTVQSPSKLIDYSLAKRPILNISNDFNEKEALDEFLCGNYSKAMPQIDLSQYDIKNVAQKFISIYDKNRGVE